MRALLNAEYYLRPSKRDYVPRQFTATGKASHSCDGDGLEIHYPETGCWPIRVKLRYMPREGKFVDLHGEVRAFEDVAGFEIFLASYLHGCERAWLRLGRREGKSGSSMTGFLANCVGSLEVFKRRD